MADPKNGVSKKSDANAEVVTTRVNVAFPFSQIRVQEPSKDLTELADIVRDLAVLVAGVAPGTESSELEDRARALATRLK